MAGIIVGTAVSMVWPTLNPLLTRYEVLPMIPGFVLSAASIFIVSRLTGQGSVSETKLTI